MHPFRGPVMIGMHMPVLRLNNWKRRYLRQIEAQKISMMCTEKKMHEKVL